MDANKTRFHLLLDETDWADCLAEIGQNLVPLRESWQSSPPPDKIAGVMWNPKQQDVTLRAKLFRFPASKLDTSPTPEDRRGTARDRYGNWYWIDETRRSIRVLSSGSEQVSIFWPVDLVRDPATPDDGFAFKPNAPPAPPPSLLLSGLAVTEDHYLVVGVLKTTGQAAGLLIFDLHSNGAPERVLWPDSIDFAPFDMSASPCGGVWILDRVNGRYWKLDRQFNVIYHPNQIEATLPDEFVTHSADFEPVGAPSAEPAAPRHFPRGISIHDAPPLIGTDPIAIEALPDDTVLILDRNENGQFSDIYRYRFGDPNPQRVSTDAITTLFEPGTPLRLIGHDLAFLADYRSVDYQGLDIQAVDRLFVTSSEGNQTFAFQLIETAGVLSLHAEPIYLPMQLFGGKGLVAGDHQAYYDTGTDTTVIWLPLIEQHWVRYDSNAVLETPIDLTDAAHSILRSVFDGREPNCVWHRLMIDACIPSDAAIRVWSRAADDAFDLPNTPWSPEPPLYRRGNGSELPFAPTGVYDTHELLFQRATGRYLQIRLELSSSGRTSPRLRALRAYYPRFSYLTHYLPAVYRQDAPSASFLDRFLANLEGMFTAIEDRIAAAQLLIDVRSASPETLDWLAGWFGLALNPLWDDAKRRFLISHAMQFFQARGTVRGIRAALRLALDPCVDEHLFDEDPENNPHINRVRIIEQFSTRPLPKQTATLWQPTDGATALHQRYAAKLAAMGTAASLYPINNSDNSWQSFSAETLGFIPAMSGSSADLTAWRDFLAYRYHTPDAYNTAYGLSSSTRIESFSKAAFPTALPTESASLQDWYDFERGVLPIYRTAHRFTVLLPAPLGDKRLETGQDGLSIADERRELVDQIVRFEKPAHTVFDVKFYWALFRLGEARLGIDTLIDLGSRAPELMQAMTLGRGYLSESYLAPGYPQTIVERRVVGRDRLS